MIETIIHELVLLSGLRSTSVGSPKIIQRKLIDGVYYPIVVSVEEPGGPYVPSKMLWFCVDNASLFFSKLVVRNIQHEWDVVTDVTDLISMDYVYPGLPALINIEYKGFKGPPGDKGDPGDKGLPGDKGFNGPHGDATSRRDIVDVTVHEVLNLMLQQNLIT